MRVRKLTTWCGLLSLVVMSVSASAPPAVQRDWRGREITVQAAQATVATPTFSPGAPYTFNGSVKVTISCSTSGATIRYTTNGSDPTSSSTVYSSPLTFTTTTTLKARAFKSGMTNSGVASGTYTGKVAPPTFSPPPGTYISSVTVTISCSTSGATIRYTTDGSNPTSSSPGGSSPRTVTLTTTTTLKAKTFKSGMTDGDMISGKYEIVVATPTFSPAAPYTFTDSVKVTISCSTSGATIRYTTDGSIPTQNSTVYSSPLTFTKTTTLKAQGFKSGCTPSAVASGTYTGKVATPILDPPPGPFNGSVTVKISCVGTSGATIRYTTTGLDPTSSSTVYSTPLTFTTTTTLKAKAFKTGMTDSGVTPPGVYTKIIVKCRVLRYDGVPIPKANVYFTNNPKVAVPTDNDGYVASTGTVKKIQKFDAKGNSHWVFRPTDKSGLNFQGAYAKTVSCQQLGASIWEILDCFGPAGKAVGTVLKLVVNIEVGLKAIEDWDDILGQTQDGKENPPYMTGWSRGYVEISVGNCDIKKALLPVTASLSVAAMCTKHPDHDPSFGWQPIDYDLGTYSNFFDLDISASSLIWPKAYTSGALTGNVGLSTSVLSFSLLKGTLQVPADCSEYKGIAGANATALGVMAFRGSLYVPGSPTAGFLGKVLDIMMKQYGVWRTATGTLESGWPCQ